MIKDDKNRQEALERFMDYMFGERAPKRKEPERMIDPFERIRKRIEERLAELEKEGVVKSKTNPDGTKVYYSVDESPEQKPKESQSTEPNFVMSKEQFVKFINDYQDLMNAFAKMKHIFGVDLNADGANWSFYDKTNHIIWSLLSCIFGKDNLDDISAFCFGDSNFDSAEQLYDELT